MEILPAFGIAIVSGLYTSLWGAFKDSPYEDFKPRTFPRSIYFSIAIGAFFLLVVPESYGFRNMNTIQLFFFLMGIERFLAELYKGFFRHEDQSKYFIPSRVTFFGKPVRSEAVRFLAGLGFVALTIAVAFLQMRIETFTQFLTVAYLSGLFVSFGGAYKDAPFEGFAPLKFQRSALVLAFASPFFFMFGPMPLGILLFMNGGLERFLVEYYKTYIKRNMSGKFRPDLKIFEERKRTREKFHIAAWGIILGLAAISFQILTR
jgi:hypothetical protein